MFMFQYSPGNTVNNATDFYKSDILQALSSRLDINIITSELIEWFCMISPSLEVKIVCSINPYFGCLRRFYSFYFI